jgi:glycosyltransferase involved in cell wall biosynthesis
MSCLTAFGEGGLGYHLSFIASAVPQTTQVGEYPFVYCAGITESQSTKPSKFVQSIRPERPWQFVYNYSPLRWLPSVHVHAMESYFDKMVSERIPQRRVVHHSFPGCAEETLRKVHRFGGTTVLEAATTHVNKLYREVASEHAKFRMGGSPFSETRRKQMVREYELADYITVSSTLQRDSFIENGCPPQKLVFAPLGIDTNRFSPVAGQHSMRPRQKGEKFRVIQVGQVSLLKGFQYVLEALKLLGDSEIELILLGGVGWRRIQQLIQVYRQAGVSVINVNGDPVPWLRSSHVCVHASIQDGFGLSPLEAMSCGLPTIVTDQTGVKDAVIHGYNGYIVNSRNVQSIADYIRFLKNNDDARIVMGPRARQSALGYDSQTMTEHYKTKLLPVWMRSG